MAFLRRLLGRKTGRRVVLVTPPSYFTETMMRMPTYPFSLVPVVSMTPFIPLGPAYLAASLREAGFDPRVVDLTFFDKRKVDVEQVRDVILSQKPEAVGLSTLTWTVNQVYDIANALKAEAPDLTVTVGGPHASAIPHRTLEECPSIDSAIIGDGEYAYRDYLNLLCEKGHCDEMAELKGTVFRHGDRVIGDTSPNYIDDLDALPFPARDLFNIDRYREFSKNFIAKKTPVASIMTSRGCPQACVFCYRASSGYKYRSRSAGNVVREIEQLHKLGFNEVQIPDDNFTADRPRVFEVCRLIKERGLDMSFDLPNGMRVDHVSEELMQTMYDVGFYSIHLGVESCDDHVLKTIRKGITVEQVKRAVKITKDIGYNIILYIIIGLPGSTVEAEARTLDVLQEMDVPFTFSICTPYPGAPLWKEVEEDLKDVSWDRYDETDANDPLYLPEGMTQEQLKECVDRANEYLLKPSM